MKIPFSKYHGTGNDFIIIDNRILQWNPRKEEVASLCDRHFGIGGDGLMLLSERPGFDFHMKYYNSDGNESTMCGNGGRCMIIFARSLGLGGNDTRFIAIDGEHHGNVVMQSFSEIVRLKMGDVNVDEIENDHFFLNTGSPHYVIFLQNVESLDIVTSAKKIRFNDRFFKEGTNVDFVEQRDEKIFVRTYERGVEDETLSCGTGVTASALAFALKKPGRGSLINVQTRGGDLSVSFNKQGNSFSDIWLEGPVKFVFKGEVDI